MVHVRAKPNLEMALPATISNDDSEFDPQTSLYGPGALLCWYLTLVCVFVTWCTHPTHHFGRLRITLDVVVFALYPCLAAGHMAILTSRFGRENLPDVSKLLLPGKLRTEIETAGHFIPQSSAHAFRGSYTVAFIYVLFASFTLLLIAAGDGIVASPRRYRLLPWLLLLSNVWVLGCFCYVVSRLGLDGVFVTSFTLLIAVVYFFVMPLCVVTLGFAIITAALISCLDGLASLADRFNVPWGMFLRNFPGPGLIALAGTIWGLSVSRIPCFYWQTCLDPVFPNLGVKMSALDQILALSTGVVALLFTAHRAFWKKCWNRHLIKAAHRLGVVFKRSGLMGGDEGDFHLVNLDGHPGIGGILGRAVAR